MPSSKVFSNLSPESVLNALEAIGIEVTGSCYALNSYENRVFQVGVFDSESVIAKFYRPGRWSAGQLFEEYSFVNFLSNRGVRLPAFINVNDTAIHSSGAYCFLRAEKDIRPCS